MGRESIAEEEHLGRKSRIYKLHSEDAVSVGMQGM